MSFPQKQSAERFMHQLDLWSAEHVIGALVQAFDEWNRTEDHEAWAKASAAVQKAIREKVLDSYRNGQRGGSNGR